MSTSGEAADQVLRMTLEGAETALKISGAGAEKITLILYKLLKDLASEKTKTKGRARLANMIRSGRKLEIFELPDKDLQRFCNMAKKYGVLYTVLKDKDINDGFSEIMVKADDSQKINHIFRRLELAVMPVSEIEAESGENKKEEKLTNPLLAREETDSPSVRSSISRKTTLDSGNFEKTKPEEEARGSVREALKRYRAEIDEKKPAKEMEKTSDKQTVKSPEHKAPVKKKKVKTKER